MMLIDPPSPFSSKAEWARFRKSVEAALDELPDAPELIEALAEAKRMEATAFD